ncbi:hypothetical protein KKD61_01705 [Patescibacteria group bacterium]|nr:hypothetical protein [Patescibacteria group bacterium]
MISGFLDRFSEGRRWAQEYASAVKFLQTADQLMLIQVRSVVHPGYYRGLVAELKAPYPFVQARGQSRLTRTVIILRAEGAIPPARETCQEAKKIASLPGRKLREEALQAYQRRLTPPVR